MKNLRPLPGIAGATALGLLTSRISLGEIAVQAAGYLAVLGPVVSEPAKLVLLRNSCGLAATASSTLIETGTYWFTAVILSLAGTCAGAFLIAVTPVVCAAAALFGIALAVLVSRRSLLTPLVRMAGARAPGWLRSAELVEHRIRSFRDQHPRAARRVLGFDPLAQLLTLIEVAVVLWWVSAHFSPLRALIIEAAGRVVKVLGAWIPGRIGADEGGVATAFALLGLPPAAGMMLAIARRLRDLFWCAAGIVWAARSSTCRAVAEGIPSQMPLCIEER
ncbi:MAG: hypothetical protein LLG20_15990 [Acidobacteriales bacterium]|nr:hypothetical protein [Terriglobales bacterium]